jgi:hypothetical protein
MEEEQPEKQWKDRMLWVSGACFVFAGAIAVSFFDFRSVTYLKPGVKEAIEEAKNLASLEQSFPSPSSWPEEIDTKRYDELMLKLAWYRPATTTELVYSSSTNVTIKGKQWPTDAPYPHGGAILPFKRILAFYGNLYSTRMGILGELPADQMLAKLQSTKEQWEAADPTTPVLPAVHYIAIVAQADGGADGMYRAVMPEKEIDKAHELAKRANGILILDLQVGKSTIQTELPKFNKYLEQPDVHLGMDPEFSMKSGHKPGDVVGTYDATDINYVINYLSEIVKEKQLPPKVLIVHRFTKNMVTQASSITPTREVQVVMHMDGWGPQANKIGTYNSFVAPEPVQFTGLKIFYKNDLKPPSTGLLTPKEVLRLNPVPIYIQYQ